MSDGSPHRPLGRAVLLAGLLGTTLAFGTVGVATAATNPYGNPGVTCGSSPNPVAPGGVVTISATGYLPSSRVFLSTSGPVSPGPESSVADGSGNVSFSETVSSSAASGTQLSFTTNGQAQVSNGDGTVTVISDACGSGTMVGQAPSSALTCSVTPNPAAPNSAVTLNLTGGKPSTVFSVSGSAPAKVTTASGTFDSSGNAAVSEAVTGTGQGTFTAQGTNGSNLPASCATNVVVSGSSGTQPGTSPVSFVAPVQGTTPGTPPRQPGIAVLAEQARRSAAARAAAAKAAAQRAAAVAAAEAAAAPASAPARTLAFTGSDAIVGGTVLGASLIAGGGAFLIASRKRSRRRTRTRTA